MNELMSGIEVLNQVEITRAPDWAIILLIVCGVTMFVSFGISVAADKLNRYALGFIFSIVTLILAIGALIGFFSMMFIQNPTGQYTYDCLISEDVSMTEFYEKYEVIETNGKIWTIKEK